MAQTLSYSIADVTLLQNDCNKALDCYYQLNGTKVGIMQSLNPQISYYEPQGDLHLQSAQITYTNTTKSITL